MVKKNVRLEGSGWQKIIFTFQILLNIQSKLKDRVLPSGFSPPSEHIANDQQRYGEQCGPRYWCDWQQLRW